MKIKHLRTGVAAAMGGAVLLAGLIVGASIAFADDTSDADATVKEKDCAFPGGFHGLWDDVIGELDIDLDELRSQLREGATLEELAETAGIDLDAAIQDAKDALTDAIDEKVESGYLSEERADALKERIESFELEEYRFGPRGDRGFGFGFGDMRGFGSPFGDFDIDLSELHDLLESGMTLDEALPELGVDIDGAIEDARQQALDRIDSLVEDGVLSEQRAADLKEMIESFELGDGFPFGRGGFHFRFDYNGEGQEFSYDFEDFPGRHGRGFGWFHGDDGSTENANADSAMLNV